MIKIDVKNFGVITVELDRKNAPNTCANFVELVKKGFYNGLCFHRVIKGFMVQGGCPIGNGTGNPGYSIEGEFKQNGVNNTLSHTAGVISMARSSMPNSAGSQFFIMHNDGPFLDGAYAAFGRVVEGMDVVNNIATSRTNQNDRPLETIVITKIEAFDEEDMIAKKV